MSSSEFLTVNETADMLRLSQLTVWRYIKSGKLPAYKIGRDWRIRRTELEQFIESNRAPVEGKS